MKKRKYTGKLTTDGKKIFEGDYIEATSIGLKYPFKIGGVVKWDPIRKKWLNLDFNDEEIQFTIKKLDSPSENMSKLKTSH